MIPTELTIACSKEKVVPGELFDIHGVLKRTDTGAGVGYKLVRIYKKELGETEFSFWYRVGNYPNGIYIFSYLRFDAEGVYEFYTKFLGDDEYESCESVTVTVSGIGIDTYLGIEFYIKPEKSVSLKAFLRILGISCRSIRRV